MIEFQAGVGPDSQAVGIALEEMFLPYVVAPRRAPVPVTVVGEARLPGAGAILMALARKTGRFLPDAAEAQAWLGKTPPGVDEVERRLAAADFILGPYTVVDMAAYPRLALLEALPPATAVWARRMSLRPAVGRGMMVVAG